MNRRNKILWLMIPTTALLLAGLLWVYLPNRRATRLDSLCRVEARSWYALPLPQGDTLYLSGDERGAASVAFHPDSVATSVDLTGVFVSREGHVVTTDSAVNRRPDTLRVDQVHERLQQADSALAHRRSNLRAEREELDDYAQRHSVVDDGYNEVMAYRERVGAECLRLDSLHQCVRRLLREKQLPVALLQAQYQVRPAARDTLCEAHLQVRREGLLLLQLRNETLPVGVSRFSVYRWGAYALGAQLYGYQDYGGRTATSQPQVVHRDTVAYPATEGGAWVNASGQLCGVQCAGERLSSRRLAQLYYELYSWPEWTIRNLRAWVKGWGRSSQTVRPLPSPMVRAWQQGDSLRYEGQVHVGPRQQMVRQGWGRWWTKDHGVYEGQWHADTLVSGSRLTKQSHYTGHFNAQLQPEGWGVEETSAGEYYAGEWHHGRRHGHGFSSRPRHLVRCGDWRKGKFRGERMVYTADRIYGIDISRYQHDIGKKKYPINWKRLRITSLGNGRRVQGQVDYPVSFVYIKSTEGRTVLNPYYAADVRQARRHGYPVGTYHFFRLDVTAAQQAAHFLKRSSVLPHDLPPMLDLEPSDAQVRRAGGDSVMFAQVLVWLRTVERRCGKRPVLYVGQNFVDRHLPHAPQELKDYDVWIARYGQFKPYVRLLHWQLTPYGRVRGIHGEVDINVFNGTKEQFLTYLRDNRK